MTSPDHAPRCQCCRELARLRARDAARTAAGNRKRREPCAVCGSTEQRNRRRMQNGEYIRLCPAHYAPGAAGRPATSSTKKNRHPAK